MEKVIMMTKNFIWVSTILIFAIYLMGSIILETSSIFGGLNLSVSARLALSQIGFLLLPVLGVALILKRSVASHLKLNYNPSSYKIYKFIFLGVIGFQLFSAGIITLQESLIPESILPLYEEISKSFETIYLELISGGSVIGVVQTILVIAVIPAVSEEMLFRGHFQSNLATKINPKKAIFYASLIFALIHFNPINFISLFIIGAFLGVIAYRSGSIIPSIFAHFLNNLFVATLLLGAGESAVETLEISLPLAIGCLIVGGAILFFSLKKINSINN